MKTDDLVGGAVEIELQLRVLIGGADRRLRRLAAVRRFRRRGPRLGQALRPQLREPAREGAQPIAVGHQHTTFVVPRVSAR
jgi:hypothetical protein